MADHAKSPHATWTRWDEEYRMAGKAKGFVQWQERAKRIIKRYRDDRGDGDGASDGMAPDTAGASKFNILWSNVQTLKPALFAKTPKPVVERRYLDRDDVGRTASVILERTLLYELDEGGYKAAIEKAVIDRLLPGRGVVWERYEPKFVPMEAAKGEKDADGDGNNSGGVYDGGGVPGGGTGGATSSGDETLTKPDQTVTGEEVASESTCTDYVDWQDFTTSPARTWEEVWWICRRVFMTREELVRRFGAKKGKEVPLDWSPQKQLQGTPPQNVEDTGDGQKRATVYETWCKTDRKVYWWAKMWSDDMLDVKDDPLRLEGFWPVPKPLFATTTNESLIPVPDYYEYQDQAIELDDLTNRISWLTKSIKSCGVYDASITELERMFSEGFENKLVPCDNMAEFSTKAGSNGMGHIWLLPIAEQAKVLNELYLAREQVKQSLYEITGISDIVRGSQAAGGAKTATEQRIKGQFASMRLNDMQAEVARFCRDALRIKGEIIAEHFDPETLWLVSGFEQYAKEQWPPEQPTPPQPGQQVMGGNGPPPGPLPGAPPAMPQPVPGSMGAPMLPPDPVAVSQAKGKEMFAAAVALLKNDKLRGFRIDIETDSIIEPDQQATQQARTELLMAISQFLPQAIEAGAAEPALKPLMARLMMFFLRGYKASRDIEAAFEQFQDDLQKAAANPKPKPPTPEEMKVQAEMQKQAAETQRMQMQAQIDAKKAQDEQAARETEMMFRQREMDMEFSHQERMLALKEREMLLKFQGQQQSAQIEAEAADRDAMRDNEAAARDDEIAERQVERDERVAETQTNSAIEIADAKATQAKKPGNGAATK